MICIWHVHQTHTSFICRITYICNGTTLLYAIACHAHSVYSMWVIHTHFSHFEVLILCTVHYFYIASSPTVVLYNCGDLSGDDCSGCLGLSADYRCGYCRPNCILSSLECGSSVIQAPNFQQCGAISVIEVSEFMLFFLLSMTCIMVLSI